MIGTLLRRISDWMVGEYHPKTEKTTEKKGEECAEKCGVIKRDVPAFEWGIPKFDAGWKAIEEEDYWVANHYFIDDNQPHRHD